MASTFAPTSLVVLEILNNTVHKNYLLIDQTFPFPGKRTEFTESAVDIVDIVSLVGQRLEREERKYLWEKNLPQLGYEPLPFCL